jgi:hypothetical protein
LGEGPPRRPRHAAWLAKGRIQGFRGEYSNGQIVSYVKISEIDRSQAKALLTGAAEIANNMQSKGILSPRDAGIPGEIARRIRALPP